jgi:hypothetical protein
MWWEVKGCRWDKGSRQMLWSLPMDRRRVFRLPAADKHKDSDKRRAVICIVRDKYLTELPPQRKERMYVKVSVSNMGLAMNSV